jgi:hypothetical protein
MEISKIDEKNINNDENLPIFIQGGGIIFGIFIVKLTRFLAREDIC